MFEKAAEEYAIEKTKKIHSSSLRDWAYEKAIHGYNKANEWHDLRKDPNDLPKDDKYVIVTDGKLWTSAYYDKDKAWMIHTIVGLHKIIKWKEVIIEEN